MSNKNLSAAQQLAEYETMNKGRGGLYDFDEKRPSKTCGVEALQLTLLILNAILMVLTILFC